MALGVTSDGEADPPVKLAFTVPAAIWLRRELLTPPLAMERVTAEPVVLETIGALPVTEEIPGAGYVEDT
jgi:hypothetical protein